MTDFCPFNPLGRYPQPVEAVGMNASQLMAAAARKKAVVFRGQRMAAAFVVNMRFNVVMENIDSAFVYSAREHLKADKRLDEEVGNQQ